MKRTQNFLKQIFETWHRIPTLALGILAIAALTGCKQNAPLSGDTNPVGTYTLVSVDGKTLPCTIEHAGHSPTIKSGAFVFNADGTCSSKIVFSMNASNESSREVKATYSRDASKLKMKWEGAGTTEGTLKDNTFTMNNEGMILTYNK